MIVQLKLGVVGGEFLEKSTLFLDHRRGFLAFVQLAGSFCLLETKRPSNMTVFTVFASVDVAIGLALRLCSIFMSCFSCKYFSAIFTFEAGFYV